MEKKVAKHVLEKGFTTCKHVLEKGFKLVVFEVGDSIGGVWAQTLDSTKLQSPRPSYQCSDFPWPETVTEMFPSHLQVMDYLRSYAQHFNLLRCIQFHSKVVGMEFAGVDEEEMHFDLLLACVRRSQK